MQLLRRLFFPRDRLFLRIPRGGAGARIAAGAPGGNRRRTKFYTAIQRCRSRLL